MMEPAMVLVMVMVKVKVKVVVMVMVMVTMMKKNDVFLSVFRAELGQLPNEHCSICTAMKCDV